MNSRKHREAKAAVAAQNAAEYIQNIIISTFAAGIFSTCIVLAIAHHLMGK